MSGASKALFDGSRDAKGALPRSSSTVLSGGSPFFIDDYANTMIVGSAMRPQPTKRISRGETGVPCGSTTAPIAGLAVVSTWIGYKLGCSMRSPIRWPTENAFYVFRHLGFRFYCLITIVFVLANAVSGIDFGAMRKAEIRARETGAAIGEDAKLMSSRAFTTLNFVSSANVHPLSAVIPIGTLLGVMLVGFWIDGGGKGFVLPHRWLKRYQMRTT